MENYVIEKVIGEGTYGVVYKATEKGSKEPVAIKKFKSVSDEQLSRREIQACSMLNHPYIVSYRHSFRHEGLLHLVFDYVCDSMTKLLNRNRNGIKPLHARKLIYQLCQALQCCHSNQIIHRDVKPDNILIDSNGDIKLCDFGIARTIQFEGDPLTDYVATRWYRPPEQELRIDRYSFDADIWSVGCVLVELITGKPLFPGATQIDQLNLIQNLLGPLSFQLVSRLPRGVTLVERPTKTIESVFGNRELPEGTLDFLRGTLNLEPSGRLAVAGCLRHPFLRPLRDADQLERKKRQMNEQKRQQFCSECNSQGDTDDGIEEEIPGQQHHSCTHEKADSKSTALLVSSSTLKGGPRSLDFVAKDSPPTPKRRFSRAASKAIDNNTTDWDSDDIQEIIEHDEDVHKSSSPKRSSHFAPKEAEAVPRRIGGRRRRPNETKGCSGSSRVDPLDHECYEDDFED